MTARQGHESAYAIGAVGAGNAPPALSSFADLPDFRTLCASEQQHAAFLAACAQLEGEEGVPRSELYLGCVVRLDRGFPAIACESGLLRAEFASQLTKRSHSRVAVGDWVCLRVPAGHDKGLIHAILPRASELARWRGDARGKRQTLAANVDVVLVCQALGKGGFALDRVVRTAVVARDCGCDVAIVLTKADRIDSSGVTQALGALRCALGPEVAAAVTCAGACCTDAEVAGRVEATRSAGAAWGVEGVRALVGRGTVAVTLGESGAGKSTLLNALLGRAMLATAAVRARDDAGRHTTVARRMVRIPGAGVIIDAPGLRSLPLVGHRRGLELVFPEIAAAARECRFRDCTHTHEPGCMVRAALDAGRITAPRFDAYLVLAREMRASAVALDPDVALQARMQ